ncbi:hypothetical protein NPIL_239461 [Nephila pilipes]|uniref:Uncharacterized protein n=1 Tax=Nephila pilipes TaxID=299642 RepID=A0A8X6QZQ6_NEPPI|nr:hypothetical protein NPIL_239461 [Nephila pilipes]
MHHHPRKAIGPGKTTNSRWYSSVSLDGVMISDRDVTPDKASFKVTEYESLSSHSCLRSLRTQPWDKAQLISIPKRECYACVLSLGAFVDRSLIHEG